MKKIVALFPGQGSQHTGMGQELFQNFALVRNLFEEASDATHINIKKLCLDGPDSDLTLTANTQPCLLTVSIAAFRVAQAELGFTPWAAAGHSLGEYSALVAANVIPFATAATWVRQRGLAMQAAVPPGQGTMAAVIGLDDALVDQLCVRATAAAAEKRKSLEDSDLTVEALVQPANYNSPGQVVIAGSVDAVQEAVSLIKAEPGTYPKGKALPLSVSAPFHCRLMAPARDRMAELFSLARAEEKAKTPLFPYIPNRTGRLNTEAGVVFELLTHQIDHPVLWKQSVQTLLQLQTTQGVEFGPGKVLQGLCKRIALAENREIGLSGVSDLAGIKALQGWEIK